MFVSLYRDSFVGIFSGLRVSFVCPFQGIDRPICQHSCTGSGGAVWCSVVQCGAVCCSVVQYVAVWCSMLQCGAVCRIVVQNVAVYYNVVRCGTMCSSVVQERSDALKRALCFRPGTLCFQQRALHFRCITVWCRAVQCVARAKCCPQNIALFTPKNPMFPTK